jgi:signal transduction histidine kinase
MEERAKELGGRLTIKTAPGHGTTLVMHLPVPMTEVTLARIAG